MEINRSPLQLSNAERGATQQHLPYRNKAFDQEVSIPKLAIPLAAQQASRVAGYNFMPGVETESTHLIRTSSSRAENSSKLNIDPKFSAALEKIQQNSFGRSFYNKIINHPKLKSLNIDEPTIPASVRKSFGRPPSATTEFTSRGAAGDEAYITMDAGMTATIVAKSGANKKVGTDAILFHELAHVWVHLNNEVDMGRSNHNWRQDVENKTSEYEGKYGGYQRHYYAPGGERHW